MRSLLGRYSSVFCPLSMGLVLLASAPAQAAPAEEETEASEDASAEEEAPADEGAADEAAPEEAAPEEVAASAEVAPPAMPAAPTDEAAKMKPNSIYVEGLGAGLFYSLNYERVFIDQVAARIGFGFMQTKSSVSDGTTTSEAKLTTITVPITAHYVGLRKNRSGLDVGAGATLQFSKGSASSGGVAGASGESFSPLGTVGLGYRLHPVGKAGFHFRIGLMALIAKGLATPITKADPTKVGFLPWGYISFGGSF